MHGTDDVLTITYESYIKRVARNTARSFRHHGMFGKTWLSFIVSPDRWKGHIREQQVDGNDDCSTDKQTPHFLLCPRAIFSRPDLSAIALERT